MITIPKSVKSAVLRLKEECNSSSLTYNPETTQFVINLLEQISDSNNTIYSKTESEAIESVCDILKSVREVLKCGPLRFVSVQQQLINALNNASKQPDTKLDATKVLLYIQNAKNCSWSKSDEHILNKVFKLVKDKTEFSKLMAKKHHLGTCFKDWSQDFETIHVIFIESTFEMQYKQKHIFSKYQSLYDSYLEQSYTEYELKKARFDFWHGVMPTATYYIYIPE